MVLKNILVVEDDMIIQMFISKVLSDNGFNIVGEARNSDEAIKLAYELHPDLILMDIGIIGSTDGIETARLITEKENIPIIFITGNSDQATLKRAQVVNPLDILFKPIDEDRLRNTLVEFKNLGIDPGE